MNQSFAGNLTRFLIRVKNNGFNATNEDIDRIRNKLRSISPSFANFRITRFAIEFDFFSSGKDLDVLKNVEKELGEIITLRQLEKESYQEKDALRIALDFISQERFWEAHEVLESIWKKETDEKRKGALQSLILLCAALVHCQKAHFDVARGIIGRAIEKMDVFDNFIVDGIDIYSLKRKLKDILATSSNDELCPRLRKLTINLS